MNLAKFFHKNTKNLLPRGFLEPKDWPQEWKKIYFKAYPRLEEFILPEPREPKITLGKSLKKRKSTRSFSGDSIELYELSTLLFYGAGLIRDAESWDETRRPYPSGGARYPLEIYLGARMIEGLPDGVYHYNVKGHFLEKIGNKEILGKLRNKINPSWAKEAALILVITAVFYRTLNKYQDRGYRYILLEAGHLAQNLYLLAAALDLKCCGLGDFLEDQLNNVLDIDEEIEGTIYVLVFGK